MKNSSTRSVLVKVTSVEPRSYWNKLSPQGSFHVRIEGHMKWYGNSISYPEPWRLKGIPFLLGDLVDHYITMNLNLRSRCNDNLSNIGWLTYNSEKKDFFRTHLSIEKVRLSNKQRNAWRIVLNKKHFLQHHFILSRTF
jgi:hypothetical protein